MKALFFMFMLLTSPLGFSVGHSQVIEWFDGLKDQVHTLSGSAGCDNISISLHNKLAKDFISIKVDEKTIYTVGRDDGDKEEVVLDNKYQVVINEGCYDHSFRGMCYTKLILKKEYGRLVELSYLKNRRNHGQFIHDEVLIKCSLED